MVWSCVSEEIEDTCIVVGKAEKIVCTNRYINWHNGGFCNVSLPEKASRGRPRTREPRKKLDEDEMNGYHKFVRKMMAELKDTNMSPEEKLKMCSMKWKTRLDN